MNVVPFERPREPVLLGYDGSGNPIYLFLMLYERGGQTYSREIWAISEAEAEAEVMAIKETGRLDFGPLFNARRIE